MTGRQQNDLGEMSGTHSLEALLSKRVAGRVRVAQAGGGAVALVVVMGLVLHMAGLSIPGSWPWQGSAVAATVPQVFPSIVIYTNVNYGAITVNGKQQPITQEYNQVMLTRKMNVVTVRAAPFTAITCTLPQVIYTQQSNPADPCVSVGTAKGIPMVSLPFTDHQLPPDLMQNLTDTLAAQAAEISAPMRTLVPVGQHYAIGVDDHQVPLTAIARAPLTAQVVVVPDLSLVGQGFRFDQKLGALPFAAQVSDTWTISAPVALQWRFTRLNGTLVPTANPVISIGAISLALRFLPDRHWQVAARDTQSHDDFLASVSHALCEDKQLPRMFVNSYVNTGFGLAPDTSSLEGCVLRIFSQSQQAGTFVMRFGALLTADAVAHRLAPSLPLASAAELKAAGG